MNRAIKYRLYPSQTQMLSMLQICGCCRFIYNFFLDLKSKVYKANGTSLGKYQLINELPALKEIYPWLAEADSSALQQSIGHLFDAYERFFKKQARYPKFKSKKKAKKSYTTVMGFKLLDNEIQLMKVGKVKAKIHRRPGTDWKLKKVTVSIERNGEVYASCLFEIPEKEVAPVQVQKTNGLDYKSDGLYADKEGNVCDMPKYFKQSQKKLRREQRCLSRKQYGSQNYEKQRVKVAGLYRHSANQRKDFLHKESRKLADAYDLITVEDLDMKAISNKGFHLGKTTLDNGYGMFLTFLKYKMEDQGKCLIKADRWYPSSQICSNCGERQKMPLKMRVYHCHACGMVMDRDQNAAINLDKEGRRIYSQS